MANLFLGFPVSRAKIAEMIEGSAPPIAHAPWHLPNGQDPLVLPTDITAGQAVGWDGTKYKGYAAGGGGGFDVYTNWFYQTVFESLDGVGQVKTGSSSISVSSSGLLVSTGGTINSEAKAYKNPQYDFPAFSWAKYRKFKTKAVFSQASGGNHQSYIWTGDPFNSKGFGLKVAGNKIQGGSGNGSSLTLTDLEIIPAGAFNIVRLLEAIFTPGSKVEFFIDDIKVGELTTNLPTGTSLATFLYYLAVKNLAAFTDYIALSKYLFYQEA